MHDNISLWLLAMVGSACLLAAAAPKKSVVRDINGVRAVVNYDEDAMPPYEQSRFAYTGVFDIWGKRDETSRRSVRGPGRFSERRRCRT